MQRVYRLLKEARERGIIPWEWIVDESREEEGASSWDDPEDIYALRHQSAIGAITGISSRRGFEVWSEKGTIRGVLSPCSTNTASDFVSCMGSPAPPRSTISRVMTMAGR